MIVVINPSERAGRSFKGLHAYCSHDQGKKQTSERVEWISTRNLAIEDPDQAWKLMAATAQSQNQLKEAAGIRAGRPAKDGPVMHVVMSFDGDEPQTPEAMQAAADELLSKLGADPARMRGKSKPKRRQFADEHQAIIYAHSDTDNSHLHLMINRVHPQTGVMLPTNNDWKRAQDWALDYSKRHGTDHKTPAREENQEMRENGEYVKGPKRKSRNAYEQEQQTRQAVNDNNRAKAIVDAQRKKDAALAQYSRDLKEQQQKAWDDLVERHRSKKAALARDLQKQINKSRAVIREEYRPLKRALRAEQAAERKTFDAMEKTFFGRAANAMKVLQVSRKSIGGAEKGLIHRTFKAATNAGARKKYFEAAQERSRKAQEREVQNKVVEASAQLKRAQESKFAQLRDDLVNDRRRLKERQSEDNRNVQMLWLQRSTERKQTFDKALSLVQVPKSFRERVVLEKSRHAYRSEFNQARQPIANEQDNTQSTAGDQDDGNQNFAPKTPRPKQAETKRLKESHTQASRKQVIEEVEQRVQEERDRKRADYIRLRQDTGTPVSEHSTSRDEFKRRKQELTETRRSKDNDPDRDR